MNERNKQETIVTKVFQKHMFCHQVTKFFEYFQTDIYIFWTAEERICQSSCRVYLESVPILALKTSTFARILNQLKFWSTTFRHDKNT